MRPDAKERQREREREKSLAQVLLRHLSTSVRQSAIITAAQLAPSSPGGVGLQDPCLHIAVARYELAIIISAVPHLGVLPIIFSISFRVNKENFQKKCL